MPTFYISKGQIGVKDNGDRTVMISGDDAVHITRALRMKEGDSLKVCDTDSVIYDCTVVSVGETVIANVSGSYVSQSEPAYDVNLYQALIKGDKFDTVVQKAVECGATRIIPVLTSRCIVRLDKKECEKKRVRWQRIADEAAKQCGRGALVKVDGLMTYKEAIDDASKNALPLFCYEDENALTLKHVLSECEKPSSVSIFIGSEGGFSPEEAAFAMEKGMRSVNLGRRILRTETASAFVLACISYRYEM